MLEDEQQDDLNEGTQDNCGKQSSLHLCVRVLLSSIVIGFHQQLSFISACILCGNIVTDLIMQRYCALAQINIEQSQRIVSVHTVYLNLFVIMNKQYCTISVNVSITSALERHFLLFYLLAYSNHA